MASSKVELVCRGMVDVCIRLSLSVCLHSTCKHTHTHTHTHSLSLSLSLSHTHTHTHTHSLKRRRCRHVGLLDPETNDPLPDYYAGVLWSLLMGPKVVRAVSSASDSIRAYAHCSARSPTDLTLLLLNLQPAHTSQPINVTISGVCQSECARVEYRLSGPRGTNATDIALNGVPLTLTPEGRLPQMQGVETKGGDVIVMPPATIVFVEVRGAGEAVGCGKDSRPTVI